MTKKSLKPVQFLIVIIFIFAVIFLIIQKSPSIFQTQKQTARGTFYDHTCGKETKIFPNIEAAFSQPKEVCYLVLERKDFIEFPKEIYEFPGLKHLLFSSNSNPLTLPDDIDRLTLIEELRLVNNGISLLPDTIGNLKKLKRLDLTANKLTRIPSSIGKLTSLEFLNLSSNQLSSIPSELGNLVSLKELYLENNNLTTLPDQIRDLKGPISLYLEGNNFSKAEQQRIKSLLPSASICFSACSYGE